jgi:hypothetical protein
MIRIGPISELKQNEATADLPCHAGADIAEQLKNLKRKYAANPAVMQTLNEYEPAIEAAESQLPKNRRTAEK